MHHPLNKKNFGKIALLFLSTLAVLSAKADDSSDGTLTRTSSNGLSLATQLTQNVYRQEPYQAHYTVQVPYQEDETYTDYETYETSDYVCHDYTDYEQQCHTESDCNLAPHAGIAAFTQGSVISRPRDGGDSGPAPFPGGGGGGGGGGGDPRPAPFPDPVRPTPVCHDRQVCENVPVTRQNCGYENVQHTRPVTKTRTVTKYRDEDRCCQTQYRSVLDHQWNLKVQVQFPQGTELMDNEQETFTVEIAGSEAAADVKFTSVSTIFGYQILSKKVDHGVATVALKQVPRFKADDLKEKTLQNFTATPTAAGLTYQFLDNGQFPRVVSQHQIVLQDVVTHQVVAQSEVRANGQRQVAGDLAINWDYTHNYEVVLKIHRQGSVIEGGVVDFQITQPLQMVLDMAALKDENKISSSIVGSLNSAQIVFKDATLPYATVSTKYYISVIRKTIFGSNKVMAEKGYSRTSLKANGDGAFAISAKEIGVSDSDAKSYLSSGSKIQIVIQVDRVTSDGQKIEFWKSANVQVK